jgi:hypothetical protein
VSEDRKDSAGSTPPRQAPKWRVEAVDEDATLSEEGPSGEAQAKAQPDGTHPVRGWLKEHGVKLVLAPLIAAVGAGLILYYAFGIGGSETSTSRPGGGRSVPTPENRTDEAAQRSFWTSPPQTYKGANESIAETASVRSGEVIAVTPRGLVEKGANEEGHSIFLVGRVLTSQVRKSKFEDPYFGLGDYKFIELHLEGREKGYDAYVAASPLVADGVAVAAGDTIFALGRVAAIGTSTDPAGHRRQTAYFMSFSSGGNFDRIDGTSSSGIRAAGRAAAP